MNTYTLLEHKELPIGGTEGIPRRVLNSLVSVARKTCFSGDNGEGVILHSTDYIKANGIVGILATNNCQLEILPKLELGRNTSDDTKIWRKKLIEMLSLVYELKIDVGETGRLSIEANTIIEVIIRIFCEKLIKLVQYGLPREYVEHKDDLNKLRGALDVNRQFTHLVLSPQKLACSYDELTQNITLNRIIAAAVRKLAGIARTTQCKNMVRKLIALYSEVEFIRLKTFDLKSTDINRTNYQWKEVLNYAKLILDNSFQTTGSGDSWGFSLLFDMSKLFEEYVGRLLQMEFRNDEESIILQGGKKSCLKDYETGEKSFKTYPDIKIESKTVSVEGIIDTKWKVIDGEAKVVKFGVKESDVYQMMAYQRVHSCNAVVLLYPYNSSLECDGVFKTYEIAPFTEGEARLYVAAIDVSKDRVHQRKVLRSIVKECITFSSLPSKIRKS